VPAILERLVSQLRAKGKSKSSAFAIATAALQRSGNLKKGTQTATAKGKRRGAMTPGQRAKDRASKTSGHSKSKYKYSSKTNRATLRSK
jgi:hypothetical protein